MRPTHFSKKLIIVILVVGYSFRKTLEVSHLYVLAHLNTEISILAPFSQLTPQTTLRTDISGKSLAILIPRSQSTFCIKNKGLECSSIRLKGE